MYTNYPWPGDVKPHITGFKFEKPDVSILNQNVSNNVKSKYCVLISSSGISCQWLPNDHVHQKKESPGLTYFDTSI